MLSDKRVSLSQFFNYCRQNSLPVAFYRLPGNSEIQVIAQNHTGLITVKTDSRLSAKKGFLFAPFQEDEKHYSVIIEPDIYTTSDKLPMLGRLSSARKTKLPADKTKIQSVDKEQYIKYVKAIKSSIKTKGFKKIVAARVIKKKKPDHFNPVHYFQSLCKKYPAAFSSLVYTPEFGLWIGATPEVLLTIDTTGFKTFSLAGTRANKETKFKSEWGIKEQHEQKIVSDYIMAAFKKVTKVKPGIQGPETITAGNLLHLRTTFIYRNIPKNSWPAVVTALHPTPAVAGLPKKASIEFIQKHESANRGFYCGYLGPVNLDGDINLFVNLRCMQVLKNKLAVYVGCGITAGSNPKDEWKESKMKTETLLSVLKLAKK